MKLFYNCPFNTIDIIVPNICGQGMSMPVILIAWTIYAVVGLNQINKEFVSH